MTSQRAEGVAEVLWELKRADKLATFSTIASRAGFSAGSNGRAMRTCLKTVRKHWPHLQWWRAVTDDGVADGGKEQVSCLKQAGFQLEEPSSGEPKILELEDSLMSWEEVAD